MLLGRLFSYPDAHRYRIGTNYQQLPINRPHVEVRNYGKDGAMRYRHSADQPVYAPNSYEGPLADPNLGDPSWSVAAGEIGRFAYASHAEDDDFSQAQALYRDVLTPTQREHVVENIVAHLKADVSDSVTKRAVQYWTAVDPDLGTRVAVGASQDPAGLELTLDESSEAA
jgi:catalase